MFTLQDSISFAQENSKAIKMAQENVKLAKAKVNEAVSAMLPKISSHSNYDYYIKPLVILDEKTILQIRETFKNIFPTLPNPNGETNTPARQSESELSPPTEAESIEIDPHNFRVSATLQQPLFTWGKLANNHRQSKLNLEAEMQSLESAKHQLTLEVTKAFYGALLAKEFVKVSEESRRQVENHLKTANDLKNAGAATTYDVLRASVQLANSRSQLIRAQNSLRLAMEGFKIILGMALNAEVNVEGEFEYKPIDSEFDQLLKAALENRPDLKQLKLQEKASEKMVSVANAGNKPNLALLSTYEANKSGRWIRSEMDWRKTTQSWNVVLALDLPIFDGFLTKAKVKQAKSGLSQIQLSKAQMEDNIRLEVKSAYLALQEAKALIDVQQETVQQAQEGLRIANLQYANGSLTSVQLIDAQLALTQAQVNRLQALHDYAIAIARLKKAIGQ
jgi:outer membrane protein TolC